MWGSLAIAQIDRDLEEQRLRPIIAGVGGWPVSKARTSCIGQKQNVLDADCWELQPYAMTVFPYADIYLGLLVIHDQVTDRAWTELAFSEDTVSWERIDSGRAFIGCGESELSYDYGCVYACARPVFLNNEVRFYYGGSDWLHFGWRKGCLALVTMRPDGFAGYRQKDTGHLAG